MSEQAEMRECPFCGGQAYKVTNYSRDGWRIRCIMCRLVIGPYATEAAAIAAWNQRAGDADNRRLRELERAVRGMTQKLPGPLWGFVFSDEDTPGDGMVRVEVTPESDVIGRLLEGEE